MSFASVDDKTGQRSTKPRYLWLCASLVPLWFVGRLLFLALSSIPESDDFCFSDKAGFIETVIQWYRHVGGRVVPLSLMQVPAKLGRVIDVDYFAFYALFLFLLAVCFALAMLFVARRLWSQKSWPEQMFLGLLFAAVLVSIAPSLHEMLYWLPGVSCYTLPEALLILIVAELSLAFVRKRKIGAAAIYWLAPACFFASLCNEFTPLWVLGWILGSLALSLIAQRDDVQAVEHAILALVTIAAASIVLLAPGNAVRRAQFAAGGALDQSLNLAGTDFAQSIGQVFGAPEVIVLLLGITAFSLSRPERQSAGLGRVILIVAYLLLGAALCAYAAHFIGRYAAAENLASRARNEVLGLLVASLTFAVCFASNWIGSRMRAALPFTIPLESPLASALIAVALCSASWWALSGGAASQRIDRDRASIAPYWLASMARHAELSLSVESDVVVLPHLVFPPVLASQDVGEDPSRLPNDCMARFYGKQVVRLRIESPDAFLAALSDYLPGFRRKIGQLPDGEITPSELGERSIRVSGKLVRGPNFSTPWGAMRLLKNGPWVQVDLDRIPSSVCVPLYRGLGNIQGIDKIEPTSLAAGYENTPVSDASAVKACTLQTGFIRFLIPEADADR
jgi:hypothetical protein